MQLSRARKILLRLIRSYSIAGLVVIAGTAGAQTIIPVDARFPPPDGFSFQGSWKCGDPAGGGTLKVGKPSNGNSWRPRSLASTWTEIRETDQDMAGNYFVAYDRDKQQFILIDADDPAYAAYSTDGWRGRELTLTSEETQSMQRHRLVYKIDSRYQFTVSFAVCGSSTWVMSSSSTCRKVSQW
jgi:hypothetical protein